MTATAIARTIGVHVSTVTRWLGKAARHIKLSSEEHLEVKGPTEIQLDELRVGGIQQAARTWAWSALEVWSRVWVATKVARRTLRSTHVFLHEIREVCTGMVQPTLFATDEFKYYAPVIAKVFGHQAAHVEVKNRYANGGIVRTTYRLRNTPEWRFDFARDRSEDSRRPNTSYIERLNLFERRSCCYLQRRTPARARNPERVENSLEILRGYYNFIKPHSSLRHLPGPTTPAMAAGYARRPLTFRQILRWVPPVERKRRNHVYLDLTQPRRLWPNS